ncbi:MAG: hypothetical protein Q4Q53_08155 [Methanocorpusculum sp.]|nr:hypothetical protein [Methanocorpusculum sp.]
MAKLTEAPSKAFSNGMEYEFFLENFCERCDKGTTTIEGFAEFPENGGCPIWDALENARVGGEFPSKDIVHLLKADGKVKYWNVCKQFTSKDESLMEAYHGLFEEEQDA